MIVWNKWKRIRSFEVVVWLYIRAIFLAINRNTFYIVIVCWRFRGSLIAIFSESWLKPTIRINLIKIGISCLNPMVLCFTGHKLFVHYEIRLIYSCDDLIIFSQREGSGCWHSPNWLPKNKHCRCTTYLNKTSQQ